MGVNAMEEAILEALGPAPRALAPEMEVRVRVTRADSTRRVVPFPAVPAVMSASGSRPVRSGRIFVRSLGKIVVVLGIALHLFGARELLASGRSLPSDLEYVSPHGSVFTALSDPAVLVRMNQLVARGEKRLTQIGLRDVNGRPSVVFFFRAADFEDASHYVSFEVDVSFDDEIGHVVERVRDTRPWWNDAKPVSSRWKPCSNSAGIRYAWVSRTAMIAMPRSPSSARM